jgi:hypothetical protein
MHTFKIEERRREVASMLAQSITEIEIAEKLAVDQSTISRDVKVLKEMSQQFVFDLAKSDLAYYYNQSIDGIEEAKKEARRMYNNTDTRSTKEKQSWRFRIKLRRPLFGGLVNVRCILHPPRAHARSRNSQQGCKATEQQRQPPPAYQVDLSVAPLRCLSWFRILWRSFRQPWVYR